MSNAGKDVVIITSFSPEDAMKYDELGVVYCEEDLVSGNAYEYCRNSLRNQAGAQGADFVLVEDHHETQCAWPLSNDKCVDMTGRIYRAKAIAPVPSARPSPSPTP